MVQAQTTLDTRQTTGIVTGGASFTQCYSLSKLLRNKRVVGNLSVWRCKITLGSSQSTDILHFP